MIEKAFILLLKIFDRFLKNIFLFLSFFNFFWSSSINLFKLINDLLNLSKFIDQESILIPEVLNIIEHLIVEKGNLLYLFLF